MGWVDAEGDPGVANHGGGVGGVFFAPHCGRAAGEDQFRLWEALGEHGGFNQTLPCLVQLRAAPEAIGPGCFSPAEDDDAVDLWQVGAGGVLAFEGLEEEVAEGEKGEREGAGEEDRQRPARQPGARTNPT